jgi:hypothetical protein
LRPPGEVGDYTPAGKNGQPTRTALAARAAKRIQGISKFAPPERAGAHLGGAKTALAFRKVRRLSVSENGKNRSIHLFATKHGTPFFAGLPLALLTTFGGKLV